MLLENAIPTITRKLHALHLTHKLCKPHFKKIIRKPSGEKSVWVEVYTGAKVIPLTCAPLAFIFGSCFGVEHHLFPVGWCNKPGVLKLPATIPTSSTTFYSLGCHIPLQLAMQPLIFKLFSLYHWKFTFTEHIYSHSNLFSANPEGTKISVVISRAKGNHLRWLHN